MTLLTTSKSSTAKSNSTKAKLSAPKPLPGPKRGSQDRGQADSHMPKAMNDPNWRARQDTESSGDVDLMEFPLSHSKNRINLQNAPVRRDAASRKSGSSSGVSAKDTASEAPSSSESLAKIVQRLDLQASNGHQMSILELDLRPDTPTPTLASGDGRSYVNIARYDPENHKDDTKDMRFKNISPAPHMINPNLNFPPPGLEHFFRQNPSSHLQLDQSRSIDESTVQYTEHARPPEMASFNCNVASDRMHPTLDASLTSRDQAFQRLLQRLNRDSQCSQYSNETLQTGCKQADEKPQIETGGLRFPTNLRRPVNGSGRRGQTISDFKIDYWPGGPSSSEDQESPEDTSEISNKSSTWNPKAREFLSLGHQSTPRHVLPWEMNAAPPTLRPKPTQNFHSLPPLDRLSWQNMNSAAFNSIPLGEHLDPQVHTAMNPYPSVYNMALTPEALGVTGYPPSTSTFPTSSMLPIPAIVANTPHSTAPLDQFSAQQTALQQMAALPYLASLASLGALNPMAAGPEKPNTAATIRRPPVPKPTLPNAGAQLAYEEWIEWRKANEPGYAVECKARQQRRCQRGKGPKSADQPPSIYIQGRAVAAA